MSMKKNVVSALFAAGTIVALATPLTSAAQVDVYLNYGPPVRTEVVPAPRDGYIWSNGYWRYEGNRHVWNEGEWHSARPGYSYRQPAWVERDGRWNYQASRWDRDGDGVRNRDDSHPNNPRRN